MFRPPGPVAGCGTSTILVCPLFRCPWEYGAVERHPRDRLHERCDDPGAAAALAGAWLGGLDKMYRLHKWLGMTALGVGAVHWLWVQGPARRELAKCPKIFA
jgi:hypothetical protein